MSRSHTQTADRALPVGRDSMLAGGGTSLSTNLLGRRARTGVRVPEIGLAAAIFEDALRCVGQASRGVTKAQYLEACEWIASDRSDWPFDFVNVCDLLGVDISAARESLRTMQRLSD